MGCRSDYMQPSQAEVESKKLCEHLAFLLPLVSIVVPDWVAVGVKEYYGNPTKVNEATALLCDTLKSLSKKEFDVIVYDGKSKRSRALADWWEAHQEMDASHLAEEQRKLAADNSEFERLKKKLGK
jgi:hypothetical protein